MTLVGIQIESESPQVVGSFGSLADLTASTLEGVRACCDIVEIRLDLLMAECAKVDRAAWHHLRGFPLLFTARRPEEGGAGNLDAATRCHLLTEVLDDATWIDIEVASLSEMTPLLGEIRERQIPWIASFHDFKKLPEIAILREAETRATDAGAAVFKIAAMLDSTADIARLAEFQQAPHALRVATMGMGLLAPVSRLLCAQCGSALNYGYIGSSPTAPGQWDSALLKQTITSLAPFRV